MTQVWKTLGRPPKELQNAPKCPEELFYLWDTFHHLKQSGPLTFSELKSWTDLTGFRLSIWEIDILRFLDRL